MLIQHESSAPAPAAVSGTSRKLLQLLRKRLHQLAWVTVVLAIGLVVAASAFAIWWLTSLNGLPDIGDPFDVAAFRAFHVPDDQNAFAFLRRAHEKLTPIRGWDGKRPYPEDPKFSWSIANPKLREWAGENREALELFLQGADRPDASLPAGEPTTRMDVGGLDYVVFFEGSSAPREQRHGGRLGLLSRAPPHDHPQSTAGKHRSALFRQGSEPWSTATDHRLGDGSEDHDPPTSYRPG